MKAAHEPERDRDFGPPGAVYHHLFSSKIHFRTVSKANGCTVVLPASTPTSSVTSYQFTNPHLTTRYLVRRDRVAHGGPLTDVFTSAVVSLPSADFHFFFMFS